MYRAARSNRRKISNPFRTGRNRLLCPPRNRCPSWASQNLSQLQGQRLSRLSRPRLRPRSPRLRRHCRPSRLLLLAPLRRPIRRMLWPGCRKVRNHNWALVHRRDVPSRPSFPRLLFGPKSRPDLCASLSFRSLLGGGSPLRRPWMLPRPRRRLFHRRWQRQRRPRSRRPNLRRCPWFRRRQDRFPLLPSLRHPPRCRRLYPPFHLRPSRPSARPRRRRRHRLLQLFPLR